MNITLIGLDLAKNVIQICGVNQAGKAVFNRSVTRHKVLELLSQYPQVPIAMEACSGSNYWGRALQQRGHPVMLLPPQHVKPFVKGNKNDRNDAFAICEAARRPNMTFVPPRTLEQTDISLVHRLRERRIGERTRLINQLRGLLNEYGIVLAGGKETLKQAMPLLLEDASNELTPRARTYCCDILEEWQQLDEAIRCLDKDIEQQCRDNEACARLTDIRGVGAVTATAMVAFVGNGSQYRNARHFSANLGLVPKEHSSGGKQKLGSITKRGNGYLRKLLIQGAWSIIRHLNKATDRLSLWVKQLAERRGKQRAAVATANKLARIIWVMLFRQERYRAA
ncbi:transposase IS116/IS110/IS902 [Oceanimonas sp. GK1]|uniref:IS110 family transposase n=1 Tax=Oceanimonas sp. (strain GK1 / IBRC-M 10197) TaxID=511062 RepID=UPI00024955C6|nr:IS110 family transposase [Oceanimonas sp. GK1]AEY02064.1 transposase IS116/IS110/IS902 [Oceanimonas sp. GK1]